MTRNEAQGRAHGIHKTIEYRANIMRTRTLHTGNGKGTTSARLVWPNVDEKVSRGNFITGSLKKTFTTWHCTIEQAGGDIDERHVRDPSSFDIGPAESTGTDNRLDRKPL